MCNLTEKLALSDSSLAFRMTIFYFATAPFAVLIMN